MAMCDQKRPSLTLGPDLAALLRARRTSNSQTCTPGELCRVDSHAPRFMWLPLEWAGREAHEADSHSGATT